MISITVKAAPGLRVPREDSARKYINDNEAVSVPQTSYYLRRLADNELILVDAPPSADPAEQAPGQADTPADQVDPRTDSVTQSATATSPAVPPVDPATPADTASARTTRKKGA
ncbi:DUF2635 domain-containing protein [Achromobacter xylosoxidans]